MEMNIAATNMPGHLRTRSQDSKGAGRVTGLMNHEHVVDDLDYIEEDELSDAEDMCAGIDNKGPYVTGQTG